MEGGGPWEAVAGSQAYIGTLADRKATSSWAQCANRGEGMVSKAPSQPANGVIKLLRTNCRRHADSSRFITSCTLRSNMSGICDRLRAIGASVRIQHHRNTQRMKRFARKVWGPPPQPIIVVGIPLPRRRDSGVVL